MPELLLIPATPAHADELALSLRTEDTAELLACGFADAREGLRLSLERSDVAWAATVDGRVAAMFGLGVPVVDLNGVDPTMRQPATVWFLTGGLFLEHARLFVAKAKGVVRKLLAPYASLENQVDARYEAAVRWVKWLGFDVGAPAPFGPAGLPFHRAILRRS